MAARASIYKNKKGDVRVNVSLPRDEAIEIAKIKGDGVLGDVAKAMRDAIKAGPRKKNDEE